MLGLKKYDTMQRARDRWTVLETTQQEQQARHDSRHGHSSAGCLVAATSAELARPKTVLLIAVLTGTLYASMTETLYIFPSKALHEVLAAQHLEAFDSLMPSLPESDYQWMDPLRLLHSSLWKTAL